MDVVILILLIFIIIGMIRLGMAMSSIHETFKMVMFEDDLPEDLRRYRDKRGDC